MPFCRSHSFGEFGYVIFLIGNCDRDCLVVLPAVSLTLLGTQLLHFPVSLAARGTHVTEFWIKDMGRMMYDIFRLAHKTLPNTVTVLLQSR